jgi:hypothetical protein
MALGAFQSGQPRCRITRLEDPTAGFQCSAKRFQRRAALVFKPPTGQRGQSCVTGKVCRLDFCREFAFRLRLLQTLWCNTTVKISPPIACAGRT